MTVLIKGRSINMKILFYPFSDAVMSIRKTLLTFTFSLISTHQSASQHLLKSVPEYRLCINAGLVIRTGLFLSTYTNLKPFRVYKASNIYFAKIVIIIL